MGGKPGSLGGLIATKIHLHIQIKKLGFLLGNQIAQYLKPLVLKYYLKLITETATGQILLDTLIPPLPTNKGETPR